MNKYQVGNIKFSFKYNFDENFKNNIEKYKINNKNQTDSTIIVNVVESIDMPKGDLIGNNNPYVVYNENIKNVIYKAENIIRILVKHTLDYKDINIYLNSKVLKDVVEAEYIITGIMFLELAMHLNYLPIHASAIKVNNEAILFSGRSGIGKSTHRRNWLKAFSDVKIINDDKPILDFSTNEINVLGSPFSGEYKLNNNIKAPLKAIVILEQGLTNEIVEINKDEVIPLLIKNILRPTEIKTWDKVLPLIGKIYDNIKIIKLYATNDLDAPRALYNYLYGENN